MLKDIVEQQLVAFAVSQKCGTFKDLAVAVGADPNKHQSYAPIIAAMNEIDRERHGLGLCLYSPLVEPTRSKKPTRGLVRLLRELNILHEGFSPVGIVEEQRQRTWAFFRHLKDHIREIEKINS